MFRAKALSHTIDAKMVIAYTLIFQEINLLEPSLIAVRFVLYTSLVSEKGKQSDDAQTAGYTRHCPDPNVSPDSCLDNAIPFISRAMETKRSVLSLMSYEH